VRRAAFGLLAAVALSACGVSDQPATAPDAAEPSAGPTASEQPAPSVDDGAAESDDGTAPSDDGTAGADDADAGEFVGAEELFDGVPASEGLDPERITIPAIDVDADVIDLGLNPDNTLEVPSDFSQTGWFDRGSRPGEYGASIIAGHIDSTDGPAVFFELAELTEGDEVEVHSADGETVTYAIERVEEYSKEEFPTQEVYSFTREPTLRLVTCGGPFDDTIGSYENNTIAFARRVA
jgi:LPXTG-site transpeptidase (sortase) family protein